MAQAARLNLRMQKELKLLLSDPPPGASFPLLSADSSSLSTIHAQIEGPGGTVYANGVFNMTIQIPERYPFQPPCVTFATPIYHPNIDNGGRICLDILNLPPKGAWQPSLNISTVLTSIGLLLSEPNPDDGLMCEASREYKYNRQAFDQKARSLTEKYAKPGANGNFGVCQVSERSSNPSKMETEGSGNELKHEVNEYFPSHKKQCRIGRKLSLESSSSPEKRDANSRGNEIPNEFENQMEAKGANNCCEQLSDQDKDVEGMNLKRRYRIDQGLLLESSDKCKTSVSNNENMPAFPRSSGFPSLSHLEVSHIAMPMPQAVENSRLQPPMDVIDSTMNDSIKTDYKKLCSVGKKLSLGSICSPRIIENRNQENLMPVSRPSNRGGVNFRKTESAKFHEVGQEELLEPLREVRSKPLPLSQDSKCHDRTENVIESTEQSAILDAIIVLDSEDSEEESNALSRSRLLVARRWMAGKRKARV